MNQTPTGNRRVHWITRMFAAGLALSVVFALTPCCTVYAAFMPGTAHAAVPERAAVSHDHSGDEPPCAAWLDRNNALPAEAGVLPTVPPTAVLPAPSAFPLSSAPFAAAPPSFVVSTSPPDALYLRYLRLIL